MALNSTAPTWFLSQKSQPLRVAGLANNVETFRCITFAWATVLWLKRSGSDQRLFKCQTHAYCYINHVDFCTFTEESVFDHMSARMMHRWIQAVALCMKIQNQWSTLFQNEGIICFCRGPYGYFFFRFLCTTPTSPMSKMRVMQPYYTRLYTKSNWCLVY